MSMIIVDILKVTRRHCVEKCKYFLYMQYLKLQSTTEDELSTKINGFQLSQSLKVKGQ